MNIKLRDNYRIVGKPHSIALVRDRVIQEGMVGGKAVKNVGETREELIAECTTIESMFDRYVFHLVKDSGVETLKELRDLTRDIREEVLGWLK